MGCYTLRHCICDRHRCCTFVCFVCRLHFCTVEPKDGNPAVFDVVSPIECIFVVGKGVSGSVIHIACTTCPTVLLFTVTILHIEKWLQIVELRIDSCNNSEVENVRRNYVTPK